MAWFPSPTLMIPLNSGLECPTGISSVALPKWSYSPLLAPLSRWWPSCTISYPSHNKSAGSALEIQPKFKNLSGTSLYPSSPICNSFWACYRTARMVCVPGKFNHILPLNSVSFPGLPWWRSISFISSSLTGKTKPCGHGPGLCVLPFFNFQDRKALSSRQASAGQAETLLSLLPVQCSSSDSEASLFW